MEQFVSMLGHEGCIATVVLGLFALVLITLMVTILVYNVYDLGARERDRIRYYSETMQRMENRQAVYMELVTKGVDKDQAYQAVQNLRYNQEGLP